MKSPALAAAIPGEIDSRAYLMRTAREPTKHGQSILTIRGLAQRLAI